MANRKPSKIMQLKREVTDAEKKAKVAAKVVKEKSKMTNDAHIDEQSARTTLGLATGQLEFSKQRLTDAQTQALSA